VFILFLCGIKIIL